LGLCGIGKTHLATALGYAACQHGYSVLFANAIDAINTLSAAQAQMRFDPENLFSIVFVSGVKIGIFNTI
jgi:DNA replication protein DnaC